MRGRCMPYLIDLLLFLLPFAAFLLWRRLNPTVDLDAWTVPLVGAGLALALAGALWFGFSGGEGRNVVYRPAELGPDGSIQPGRTEARP